MSQLWRVGSKVRINVYEGDQPGRPICQCHNVADAERIVAAVNRELEIKLRLDEVEKVIGRLLERSE